MPSSHCTILARFFTRRQVLMNRWQMPEIGGKSVLVHASDNRTVWIIKDAIWGNRRCVADAHEIFGMLNIWSCWQFKIMLCEWVLTEKYIGNDLQPMREQDTGKREVRGGLFFFFYKAINVSHLQTRFKIQDFYLSHTRLYREYITSNEMWNVKCSMDSANIIEYKYRGNIHK